MLKIVNQNYWKRQEITARGIAEGIARFTPRGNAPVVELSFAGYLTIGELSALGTEPAYAVEQNTGITPPHSALVRVPDVLFKVVIDPDPAVRQWALAPVINNPLWRAVAPKLKVRGADMLEYACRAYPASGMCRLLRLAVPPMLWQVGADDGETWECLSLTQMEKARGVRQRKTSRARHCKALKALAISYNRSLSRHGIDQVLRQVTMI